MNTTFENIDKIETANIALELAVFKIPSALAIILQGVCWKEDYASNMNLPWRALLSKLSRHGETESRSL